MNTEIITTHLHNGAILKRYPATNDPNSVGTVAQWAEPLDQIKRELHPHAAKSIKGLVIEVMHLDRPEAAHLRKRNAAGLHFPGMRKIQFSVHANRPPAKAVKTFDHEFFHFYQHEQRIDLYKANPDDVTRAACAEYLQSFDGLQGHNVSEEYAEDGRAACGSFSAKGFYSDGNKANLSPGIIALYRCGYWLCDTFKDKPFKNLSLYSHGLMFEAEDQWFWLDSITFTLYRWEHNWFSGWGWERV